MMWWSPSWNPAPRTSAATSSSRSTSATTTPHSRAEPGALRERASVTGILLDFDGSLSEIVDHPDLARPVAGAREVLSVLAASYGLVAIVTGRRSAEVGPLLEVDGVTVVGLYGFEDHDVGTVEAVIPSVEAAAAAVPEAWVEDKGASIAVHYRRAPDPVRARSILTDALGPVAERYGLESLEGKMVIELVPPGRPMKGGAVERLVHAHRLQAVLYAGDDHADLDAFAALDRLAERGVLTIRVAVRGDETPPALVSGADVVVEGPTGLVELLRSLADEQSGP